MPKIRRSLTPKGDTVIRIVSGIQEGVLAEESVTEDIRMVRSALLYADRVEMYSLGTTMFLELREIAGRGDDEFIRWMLATMSAAQSLVAPQFTSAGLTLASFDQAKAKRDQYKRSLWRALPKSERAEIEKVLLNSRNAARQSKSSIDQMWTKHGGTEIEEALDSGLLTVNHEWSDSLAVALNDDNVDAGVKLINEALRPDLGNVMVDNMVGSLARAMMNENRLKVPSYRMTDVRETALGTKMILNLPNMAIVNVEKVLQVREEVAPSLGKYRLSIAKLNELLQEDPLSPELSGEIDHVWYKEVAPNVDELERAVFDSNLGQYKDALKAGARAGADSLVWGSLSIGIANYAEVDWGNLGSAATMIGAGLVGGGGAVASAKSGIDAFKEELERSRTNKTQAQNDGLFYLASINHSAR